MSKTRMNYRNRINITYTVTTTTTDRLFNNAPTRVRCTTRVKLRRRLKLAYSPIYNLMRVPYVRQGTFTTTHTLSTGAFSGFSSKGRQMDFSRIIRIVHRANGSLPDLCGRASRNNLTGGVRGSGGWGVLFSLLVGGLLLVVGKGGDLFCAMLVTNTLVSYNNPGRTPDRRMTGDNGPMFRN